MSSVPSGKRQWKCPECGGEVLLSMTQLDPIACEGCLAKMKGTSTADRSVTQASAGPLHIWQELPDATKLVVVLLSFVVGALLGLTIGYLAGKASAPRIANTGHDSPGTVTSSNEKEEERPPQPGPNYKWVRGRERKDGTRGPGHWAKDPFYKGDDSASPKTK